MTTELQRYTDMTIMTN